MSAVVRLFERDAAADAREVATRADRFGSPDDQEGRYALLEEHSPTFHGR